MTTILSTLKVYLHFLHCGFDDLLCLWILGFYLDAPVFSDWQRLRRSWWPTSPLPPNAGVFAVLGESFYTRMNHCSGAQCLFLTYARGKWSF